jgi:predicted GNAT family N-acyltransferase
MDKLSYKLVTSDKEYKGAFEVRRQVFVDEQGISEDLVFDGHDEEALQMVVKDGERVIGTARVQFLAANQAKLERMALLKPFQNKGIGKRMVSFLNEELKNRQVEQVVLHAQYKVVAFYKSCGFKETGSPFWEASFKHIRMQQRL